MKDKLENEIQNEIFDFLLEENFFFWRSNNIPVFGKNNAGKYMHRSMPKHTPKGISDIIVIHRGIFYAIEVKRENEKLGKLSEDQANFGANVVNNGGIYVVARCVEDVKKVLTF